MGQSHPRPPRRRLARRGRSAIVSAAATMVVLNVALGLYVHFRPGFRNPVFDAKQEAMAGRFAAADRPLKVMTLGSSRTAAAIEPAAMERALQAGLGRPVAVFNMGLQGDGPVSELIHGRRLLANEPRPDVVTIELLPSAFSWYVDDKKKIEWPYDATVLKPYRLVHPELEPVIDHGFPAGPTRHDWWESQLNPWAGFHFQLLAMVQPKWLPPGVIQPKRGIGEAGGWGPWEVVPPAVVQQRVDEVKKAYAEQLKVLRFHGPHAEAYRTLVREYQAAGVRVAIVVFPEGSEYRSWYPAKIEADLQRFMEELRSEFGVMVVDTRAWLPDEAFADSHHVVRPWAGKYAERLAAEVVGPLAGN